MVTIPQRPAGLPPPFVTSVVRGTALCVATDLWGRNYPVPSTTVALRDRALVGSLGLLGSVTTETDGSFSIAAPTNLMQTRWALRLLNDFTGEFRIIESDKFVGVPDVVNPFSNLFNIKFDLGRMLLPWDPQLPTLARIGSRDFRHFGDLAHALATGLTGQQGAVWLLLEFDPANPARDRDLDQMFRDLEAETTAGSTGLAERIIAEVGAVMKPKPFTPQPGGDAFALALKRIAAMTSADVYRQLKGQRLGDALKKAFQWSTMPRSFYEPIPAMACACVLIYVAGHVAQGHGVSVRLSSMVSMAIPKRHRHYKMIDITIS
jgi:hypothetical protein